MNTEFIPPDRALRLKELGFDKTCFGCFGVENEFILSTSFNSDPNLIRRGFIAAPTFSQAFRWFRENYSWTIKVNQVTKSNWSYTLDNFPKDRTYYGEVYKTYEEAELACLDKLIEIIEH